MRPCIRAHHALTLTKSFWLLTSKKRASSGLLRNVFPPQCHTQSNPHNHVLRARRAGETEVKSACSKVKGRISEVKPLLASSTLNKCENLQVQYVWRSWFWATGACVSFQNGSLTRVDAATVSFALCYPSCSPLRGWAEFAHTVASRLIITKAYFKH